LKCSDYYAFNDVLLDLKLSPDALQVPVPRYLVEERSAEIETRRKLLVHLLIQESTEAKDFAFGRSNPYSQEITIAEAILIVQRNERGRQGKLRAKYMSDIKYTC
jgi:hypothetical protein